MSTDRHSELEKKFTADHVSPISFQLWCEHHHPVRNQSETYPDAYYRQGENVVRHRQIAGGGELTVKQRKSATDITDRVEVDLTFSDKTNAIDVSAFLLALGWRHDLTLIKNFSNVYWFKHGGATVSVSLYEVRREGGPDVRRFIEVEIEKGSDVTDQQAMTLLSIWSGCLADDMDLGDPLTESLYELYSGHRYVQATCDRSLSNSV